MIAEGLRSFFFFNDTATTEIYTLSLHDALPIWRGWLPDRHRQPLRRPAPLSDRDEARGGRRLRRPTRPAGRHRDRKSTRLNSSHANISYAVFCLKKKQNEMTVLP